MDKKREEKTEKLFYIMNQMPNVIHRRALSSAFESSKINLPPQHIFILKFLFLNDKIGISELRKKLNIAKAQMSIILKKLEEANLIKKEIDEKDKRKIWIKLTPKGKTEIEILNEKIKKNMKKMLSKLDEKELEKIIKSFEYILKTFSKLK